METQSMKILKKILLPLKAKGLIKILKYNNFYLIGVLDTLD